MLRIGLTGGIASGKSTVADEFAALGAQIIDTDAIARELVVPGSPALTEIAATFGPDVLCEDGSLDRRELRRRVFSDPAQRRRLEQILHPRIRARALAEADASKTAYVILVVPLLFESGFDRIVDRTLVVDCPRETQLERLMVRDGIGADEANAIIDAQLAREDRIEAADDIIDNSGDIAAVRSQVARLNDAYLALAQNCSTPSGRAE